MLHRFKRPTLLSATFLGTIEALLSTPDDLKGSTKTEQQHDFKAVDPNETGWDRVLQIIHVNDHGELTDEAETICNVAAMSALFGCLYGGINSSKLAYMDFIRNNQATSFENHYDAKRQLRDKVTNGFARGAFKWSWRLSLFCSAFVTGTTVISKYRGKSGLLEYPLAGCIAGTLYKFNGGPRAWVVGGAVGSILGFVGGCFTLGLLKLTGLSMDDVRFWNYHIQRERSKYFKAGLEKYLAEQEDPVYMERISKIPKTQALESVKDGNQ